MNKKIIKKSLYILTACLVLFSFLTSTLAKTTSNDTPLLVWSENDSSELQGRVTLDYLLTNVTNGDSEYIYTYNKNQNRITKSTEKETTTYVYNSDSQLIEESRSGRVIKYLYQYNELIGFQLDGETYYYIKDDNMNVISIHNNLDLEVARYEYNIDGSSVKVLGLTKNGKWVDLSNEADFIGNINLIRLHSCYYDSETGYYYDGKYYFDPVTSKYIGMEDNLDQISTLEDFLQTKGIISTRSQTLNDVSLIVDEWVEELFDTASYGTSISYSSSWYSSLSDVEVLARLIYGENTSNIYDQAGVAWVLYNRYSHSSFPSTYRGVATASGQFATITGDSSETYNSRTPSRSSTGFEEATYKACTLLATLNTSYYETLFGRPTGINIGSSGQLYFVGLAYFLNNAEDGTYNGDYCIHWDFGNNNPVPIKDLVIVDNSGGTTYTGFVTISDINTCIATNGLTTSQHNIFFDTY